jgi:hypothetical protein
MMNVQSTLHTAPDLFKYFSLAVLFDINGNSYTNIRISTCSSHYRDAGLLKKIKILGRQRMLRAKKIFPRAIASPALP